MLEDFVIAKGWVTIVELISALMDQYGYLVLFLGLFLEMIALPIPGETMMTYVGFLTFVGEMKYVTSIFVAWLGSILGMTIDYWLGYKLGFPFFKKHGHRFFMGPKKFEKAAQWFDRYGVKVVMIGYFIPGVRHFTAYFGGITRASLRRFLFYAYTGALIWAVCFISLGNYLGYQWENVFLFAQKFWLPSIIFIVLLGIGGLIYYQIRRRRLRVKQNL